MASSSFLGALTGGAIGSAVVRLVLDSSQYTGQLAAAKGETVGATTSMSSGMSKFKGLATAAYAAAGIAAVKFASEAIGSAIEHQKVLTQLVSQVGENTKAFEDQATALQNLSGVQDEAILSADTMLSRFKLTDEQVRSAIPTVLDYAQATGKAVPDAARAIGKALLGNTRALKEVGIQFTATGNTGKDFADVLSLLQSKVGGSAAAFGKTTAGQLAIAEAKFDDVKEAIGGQLLPAINEILPILTKFAEIIGGVVTEALQAATDSIGPIIDGLDSLGGALSAIGGSGGSGDSFVSTMRDKVIHGVFDSLGGPVLSATRQIGEFQKGMDAATEAAAENFIQTHDMVGVTRQLKAGLSAAVPFLFKTADGESSVASAAHTAWTEIRKQREEMRLLVGGQIGLLQAQTNVKEAQDAYNTAVQDSGPKSKAATAAALDLVNAQLDLKDQLQQQKDKLREVDTTLDSVVAKFDAMARSLGVNAATLKALNTQMAAFNSLARVGQGIPGAGGTPVVQGNQGGAPAEGGPAGPTRTTVNINGPVYGADSEHLARTISEHIYRNQVRNAS